MKPTKEQQDWIDKEVRKVFPDLEAYYEFTDESWSEQLDEVCNRFEEKFDASTVFDSDKWYLYREWITEATNPLYDDLVMQDAVRVGITPERFEQAYMLMKLQGQI